MAEARQNIPAIGNVKEAVLLYYQKPALRNADILVLFPGIGNDTVQRLKRLAREKTKENGKMLWHSQMVNTPDAYEAWGLDIRTLEAMYAKLRKLGVET